MKIIILTASIWCLIGFTGIMAQDSLSSETTITYDNSEGLIKNLADPHIFKQDDIYYLYGTSDPHIGFKVFTSDDLINWSRPKGANNGFALHKNDVWGNKRFWAPEVIRYNNKFYMFYTVQSRLAVATSKSPLGPFSQPEYGPLHPETKEIDSEIFLDHRDGTYYLYFCRFDQANVIFGAEMNDDLLSVKEETVTRLIDQTEEWEHTDKHSDWPVTEAPFVMKHEDLYYLFYTANHFKNPDYAVGYAVSSDPLGPFKKYEGNPILASTDELKGTGTTSIVTAPNDERYIFYHTHKNSERGFPRKTAMDPIKFVDVSGENPDKVKVLGPTSTPQNVEWLQE